MIALTDVETLGKPIVLLPEQGAGTASDAASCHRCEAFRPAPQLSGNLQVDPEIHLPSPGMDVDIAYYYNSNTPQGSPIENGPYGYMRSISAAQYAQFYGTGTTNIILMRGNGALVTFTDDGTMTGTYNSGTPGVFSKVHTDTVNGLIRETTPDGITTAYPLTTTYATSLTYVEDAVGNRHTYSYASGLLSTIEDAVGRLVTFNYASGLLQSIQDWADRRTTFQYDTTTASPKNLLTTIIGPTGCQTGYQYSFTGPKPHDWLLTGIIDPNGYGTSYTYNADQQIATRTVAGVGTTTYTYDTGYMQTQDALGNITTQTVNGNYGVTGVIDPLGGIITISRNAQNQPISQQNQIGAIWTSSYDSNGNLTGTTDPLGHQTTYTYDAYNNQASVQTADGALVTNIWGYAGGGFDTTGAKRRLQAQINQEGEITSYTYNSRGQLVSAQNGLGHINTIAYNSLGKAVTQQNALGYIWTSSFDLADNVTAQTNPLGNTWTTTYDNQNRPLTQTDPLGNVSTVAYDNVGNRLIEINPLGYRTTYSYNVFDNPTTQTDALGNVRTVVYDQLGRRIATIKPLGNRNTIVYDELSRPVKNVDPLGNITTTVFDIASRPVATIDPLGRYTTLVYDQTARKKSSIDALGNYTTTVYDDVNRPIATQNALGYLITFVLDKVGRTIATVDAQGNRFSTSYDKASQPIAFTNPLGYTNTTVYDAVGQTIAKVDALNNRTTTHYDIAGRADSMVDPLGRTSTTVFDEANRRIADVDTLGNWTTTSYDKASQPISIVDPLNRVVTVVFNAVGQDTATLSPLGNRATTNYDENGRIMSTQDALGRLTTRVYDNASRQLAVVSPLGYRTSIVYDVASQPISTQDALGFFWTTSFFANGWTQGTVDPLGNRSTNAYDYAGRMVGWVDALNNHTTIVLDEVGRTKAVQDGRGHITSFAFNAAGQQTAIITANNSITTSLYDARGLVYSIQDPLGAFMTYQFDAIGNTIKRIDARNLVTTYTQDVLNRTVATLYQDGTRITVTFDNAGQQTTMQDLAGVTSFGYDFDGRQNSVAYPGIGTLTYTFDAVGNRTLLTDIDGDLTTYTWNSNGQIIGIVNPFSERTTISYDALDRERHRVLGNGMALSHTFDQARRETLLANYFPDGPACAVFTNTYDAIGNRLGVLELDGSLVTYSYDASYQLVNEQRSGTTPYNTTYVYDGMGNRLVQNDSGVLTTYTYNIANELLRSVQAVSAQFYQYNSGGAAAVPPFAFDAHYGSASTIQTATNTSTVSTAGVTDPAPMAVYQSMRLLANGSTTPLFYVLPSLTPGATYKVRLHWATFSDGSTGQRSINVLLNGQPVISHLDVFAAAGGDLKALVREVSGIADGAGNLVVALTADAGFPIMSAFINGIEVLPGSMTYLSIDSGGSGSSPYVADTDFSGGSTFSTASSISTAGVVDPAPMAVYQTVRYGNFSYTLSSLTPVASYVVRLHFAEIFWSSVGQRVFNVTINGTTVLSNVDIIAASGSANQAIVKEFNVVADGSGNIAINFTSVVDNAAVNGIELLGGSGVLINSYDPNGNLLQAADWTGTTAYTWDNENRLTAVANSLSGTETYTYASDGMRRRKATSAETTNLVWDGLNVLQERNISNVRLAQYTDFPGSWGNLTSQRLGNVSSFYGFDSQGNSRVLVDINGTITDSYNFKAFGMELAQGTSPNAQYTNNPYRYVGQYGYYRDDINRLYVRARHLSNTSGRWITRDPLQFDAGDYNLYRNVTNNPIHHFDPSGLFDCYASDSNVSMTCQIRKLGKDIRVGPLRTVKHTHDHHPSDCNPKCHCVPVCIVTRTLEGYLGGSGGPPSNIPIQSDWKQDCGAITLVPEYFVRLFAINTAIQNLWMEFTRGIETPVLKLGPDEYLDCHWQDDFIYKGESCDCPPGENPCPTNPPPPRKGSKWWKDYHGKWHYGPDAYPPTRNQRTGVWR